MVYELIFYINYMLQTFLSFDFEVLVWEVMKNYLYIGKTIIISRKSLMVLVLEKGALTPASHQHILFRKQSTFSIHQLAYEMTDTVEKKFYLLIYFSQCVWLNWHWIYYSRGWIFLKEQLYSHIKRRLVLRIIRCL